MKVLDILFIIIEIKEIKEKRKEKDKEPKCQPSSNRFKVLISRVMKTDISNKGKEKKKLLREVMVKIKLKQEYKKKITIKVLLDSKITKLIISFEFIRKNKFKKKARKANSYEKYE